MAFDIPTAVSPSVSLDAVPTPYNSNRVSAKDKPGYLAGETMAQVGKVVDRYAEAQLKAKKEADAAAVQNALNQQRKENQNSLDALRMAEGKDAAVVSEGVYKDSNERARALLDGLVNQDQRDAFTREVNGEQLQFKALGESHVGHQIVVERERTFHTGQALALGAVTRGAAVPGLAEREAAATEKRAVEYGAARGMSADDVKALTQQQLGQLYGAQIRTLLAQGNVEMATTQLRVHQPELGADAAELEERVERVGRAARADTYAEGLQFQHALPNGGLDQKAGDASIDKAFPAGPARDAAKEAWAARVARAERGQRAIESQAWDNLLNDYQTRAGRSAWSVEAGPMWNAMGVTPDMRERIKDKAKADQREAQGLPLTDAQMDGLLSLETEMAVQDELWGTRTPSDLRRDARFARLPDRFQLVLGNKLVELHKDRANPEGLLKSADATIIAEAQAGPILSSDTKGKAFDKWSPEDQAAYQGLRDRMAPLLAAERALRPGERIPAAVIQKHVRDLTRQGSLATTGAFGWRWLDTKTTKVEAAKRPAAEQARHPFIPALQGDEDTVGREVLRRQGWDPSRPGDAHAFRPEAIVAAARAKADAARGPTPQQRLDIEAWLRAHNAPTDPDTVQARFEWETLKFTR